MRARHIGIAGLLGSLLLAGCERAVFGFVNRGLPPPEASVAYAPERGLSLDVYRPRAGAGSAPVLVFFYGGSWERGARAQYRFVGRRLAEQGVLVVVPDYRKAPQPSFPGFMHDAADAVRWAREHAAEWGGDTSRLFLGGHSAGAQIAALLGTDARYLDARGLRPAQLAGVIGLAGPYDFVVSGGLVDVFGPSAQWPRAQAVNFVDGDEPPFLLVHGERDRVVETIDSTQLAQRLRERGGSARLLLLPEGQHITPLAGIYDPARAPEVMPAVLEFLRPDDRTAAE
jgi:acetyl esterase/lipase